MFPKSVSKKSQPYNWKLKSPTFINRIRREALDFTLCTAKIGTRVKG